MGSPALFGKLACFEAALRKNAFVAFGLFSPQDNLSFIPNIGQGTTLSTASLPYASSLVFDTSVADVISVTLTGNVASMTLNYGGSATVPGGQRNWIRLIQDSTGGRTVAWPSNLIYDQNFSVDPGANRATVVPIQYDSSLSKWKFFEEPFSVPTA